MNKQEAIEKIEELKKYSCGALGDDWISLGIDKALNVVKQLDEPEKPVLTKEEAEWLEGLKELSWLNKYDALYYITRQGLGHGFSYTANGHKVVLETPNKVDDMVDLKARLVNAMLFGYTVKEEKLYTVKFANEDFGTIYIGIFKKANKIGLSTLPMNNEYSKCYFTESELKELKFWNNPAFEVKEVDE